MSSEPHIVFSDEMIERAARVLRPGDFADGAHPADADRTREHAEAILRAALTVAPASEATR